jgi:hypothetical protein
MTERYPTPSDWPTALPPPSSPDLPAAVARWLQDVLPADRWWQDAVGDDAWILALMAMASLRRQLDALRGSWRDMHAFGQAMNRDTLGRVLAAHKTEAERLTTLMAQVARVELELLHASARGATRRLKG